MESPGRSAFSPLHPPSVLQPLHPAPDLLHTISRMLARSAGAPGEWKRDTTVDGDVQPNPGPTGEEQAVVANGDIGMDAGAALMDANKGTAFFMLGTEQSELACNNAAESSSSRKRFACPFTSCPCSQRQLSKAQLAQHLCAKHVSGGEAVHTPTLAALSMWQCHSCRTLTATGNACTFCQRQEDGSVAPQSTSVRPVETSVGSKRKALADSSAPTRTGASNLPCLGSGTPCNQPMPMLSPPLAELLAANIPTMRHIPNACRRDLSVTLGELLAGLTAHPTWELFHNLMCLPKLVLGIPKRRGQAHRRQAAADVTRRLCAFRRGDLSALWVEALRRPSKSTTQRPTRRSTRADEDPSDMPEAAVTLIKALVQEGALSKAAEMLVSEKVLDASDPAVLARLKELHPIGEQVSLGGDNPLPRIGDEPGADLDEDEWPIRLMKALTAFPPGSAPGPSGLRPGHLKDLLRRPGTSGALLEGLLGFCRAAILGKLPNSFAPWLCASTLVPLSKKDGGVRPIAVGDTLRRLAGKLLLNLPDVQDAVLGLRPRQVGVRVPFATEMVGMGVQRMIDTLPAEGEWVTVQLDMSNAFNTVSRAAMLRQCLKKSPMTYSWLAWCYEQPCPLYCQGQQVAISTGGVHQGDAMGPLGFALGLEEALDAVPDDEEQGVAWNVWYLDDGTISGRVDDVLRFVDRLAVALGKIGLVVNPSKCVAFGPGIMGPNHIGPSWPSGLPENSPLRQMKVESFEPGRGLTVLGVPIDVGNATVQADAAWDKAVERTRLLLTKLRALPDGQIRHCLVRYCLDACRVNHLMRSTKLETGRGAAEKLSNALREAATDLVGCALTADAWEQVTLPISKQGMGVRDPAIERPAARLAALAGLQARGTAWVGAPDGLLNQPSADLHKVLQEVGNHVGTNHDPLVRWQADPGRLATAEPSQTSQRWWAEQVSRARLQRLRARGSARDRCRLQVQDGPLANGWMKVLPSAAAGTVLSDVDYRSLCRWWLGLPILPQGCILPPCSACGEALDTYGDHLVCCPQNGLTRRHHALRDAWSSLLTKAGASHAKEVEAPSGNRPADLLLKAWDKGTDIAVDLTVSHPFALDQMPLRTEKCHRHLAEAEASKQKLNAADCAAARWGCMGIAYNPWGGQGPDAKTLLFETLKKACGDLQGWPKVLREQELRIELALTLAREVARQLRLRVQVQDAVAQDA